MGHYTAASGIKVLDRAVAIARATVEGPRSLAQLCEATGLPRATVHRLASALEVHGILERGQGGLWTLCIPVSDASDSLLDAALPLIRELVEQTGESSQLYRLTGLTRTCVAAEEPASGLRHTVPVGSQLPLHSGSAARVILAYSSEELRRSVMDEAAFSIGDLAEVRRAGLAESVSEREVGLASVSAPVLDSAGELLAVLSISGPVERFAPSPAAIWGDTLLDATRRLEQAL